MAGSRLTVHDRGVIERGVAAGLPVSGIAVLIGKHRTTVARELARGSGVRRDRPSRAPALGRRRGAGRPSVYRAGVAQQRADRDARRPKAFKLSGDLGLVVSGLLQANWSPQQVAAMLPVLFPDREDWRVSHETIYQSLFVQTRGELRRELTAHLRTGRSIRRAHGPTRRGRLTGTIPISARPAEADDRAVPGHWEGDLLLGGVGKGAVITLVERTTRFVLLAPLPDTHTAVDLRQVLTPMIASLPGQLRKTLAWDNGKEMAQHAQITIDAGIDIYFCDPHSPWQRGSNENTNGLLRQYWPKGSDLRHLTQTDCDEVALSLNTRPRQTLAWKTPHEALNEALRATAA
jgi:IS30 family transposase